MDAFLQSRRGAWTVAGAFAGGYLGALAGALLDIPVFPPLLIIPSMAIGAVGGCLFDYVRANLKRGI